MVKRPSWKKSNVLWDDEVLIWERMTRGDRDAQVGRWLDSLESGLHLDLQTIAVVRQ